MKRISYFILTVLFILSACQPSPGGQGQADAAAPVELMQPDPTSTPIPDPIRPDEILLKQMYSDEQIQTITNGDFQEQEEQLAEWWAYWQQAVDHPFEYDSQPTYLYYWDESGKAGGVLIQPGGTYLSRSFYFPISKDGYMTVPPTAEEGFTIPEGFGSLEVSGGDKYVLGWRVNSLGQEGWVRLDESGEIAEVINPETRQWQPERFYFLTPELKKGCEYNLIRPDHIEEDMGKLLEKERALGLTAEDAFAVYNNGYSSESQSGLRYNSYTILGWSDDIRDYFKNSEEIWKNRKISCSYMPTPDGHGIYVFGIPIRRIDRGFYPPKKTDTWGWFHFGVDPVVYDLETFPNEKKYFEEEEYYRITQDLNSNEGVIYIPRFIKAIRNGTIEYDDFSKNDWDERYLAIIDLLKTQNLGIIEILGGAIERTHDPEYFLREFVLTDHTRIGDSDTTDILSNLEKAQKLIIPTLALAIGQM